MLGVFHSAHRYFLDVRRPDKRFAAFIRTQKSQRSCFGGSLTNVIGFQNTLFMSELQRKRALNDPTSAGCINTRSVCLHPKKMLMPFNSQSCRKRKKKQQKKTNWLPSPATRSSAELSLPPTLNSLSAVYCTL